MNKSDHGSKKAITSTSIETREKNQIILCEGNSRTRGDQFSRKTHAVSHSPKRDHQSHSSIVAAAPSTTSAWNQGEALRLFKEIQKKMLNDKDPDASGIIVDQISQQSRSSTASNCSKPYLNKIISNNKHSKSVATGMTKNQSTISHDSSSTLTQ